MESEEIGKIVGLVICVIIIIVIILLALETSGHITMIFKRKNRLRVLQEAWSIMRGKDADPVLFHLTGIFDKSLLPIVDNLPMSSILDNMEQYIQRKFGKIYTDEYIDPHSRIFFDLEDAYYYGNVGKNYHSVKDNYECAIEEVYDTRAPVRPDLGRLKTDETVYGQNPPYRH